MKRTLILGAAVLAAWLGMVSVSEAQVFIRAPFVRVSTGDGVWVRAPLVNLYTGNGTTVYRPFGPWNGPPVVIEPAPAQPAFPVPPPQPMPKPEQLPPPAIQPGQALTLDAFAKTFQPKAGSYEVTLLNPVTKQPTAVRFTLPEGAPRQVRVTDRSVEFHYGFRQWTRIEFDKDGAVVTTR